ncbi:MAG: hypothetical protein VYB77_02800 [Planctomycetota bacterium]|nr:hypothetical protein [Planctomycetota bacterium]
MTRHQVHRSHHSTSPIRGGRPVFVLAASLAVLGCRVPTALGQNALGQGDVLDSGLQQSMTGQSLGRLRTPVQPWNYGRSLDANMFMGYAGQRDTTNRPSFRPDYQVGNLLVTGSIAGGKNFRGAVGYLAPKDFREEVGSDEIFPELQGSALSQIQYVNSPMANSRYASAAGLGLYEYRRDYTPSGEVYNSLQAGSINQDRIRLDRTNAYTSSSNLYDTAVTPSSLYLMVEAESDDDMLISVESNALQGIYSRKMDPLIPQAGIDLFQRASIYSGIRNGTMDRDEVGLAYRSPTTNVAAEYALNGLGQPIEPVGAAGDRLRVDARSRLQSESELDAYEQVVRALVEQYQDDESVNLSVNPEVLERVREEMDLVRSLTTGIRRESSSGDGRLFSSPLFEEESTMDLEPDPAASTAPPGGEETDESASEEEQAEQISDEERREFLRRAAETIRNGGRIDSFVEGQRGRIAELMERGEELLARGAYFDAEARFDHVLDINPGNPLALLGRANAQLGAGLFLSSALSLRKVFGNYPEIIGTRLASRLLPNRTRLIFAKNRLAERIERGKDLPSYGLCLAYVGRLLGEPDTVREGLSLMDAGVENESLAFILGEVWLDEEPTSSDTDQGTPDPTP